MSVFVRSSIDGYASNIGSTFTQAWDTTTTGRSIDLSAPAFQDITTATTFRLYIFDSGVDTASNGLRLDNVVLNGDVLVVPEPSSGPARWSWPDRLAPQASQVIFVAAQLS